MLNAVMSSLSSSSLSAASPFLFVYGTLMSPVVVSTLLGRIPTMITDVTLFDHARYAVRNQIYPGMIPRPGANVKGILLPDLTATEFQILDLYEGDEYQRQHASVMIPASGVTETGELRQVPRNVPAVTYVWTNPETELEVAKGDWNFDLFCQHHLEDFLGRTVEPYRRQISAKLQLPTTSDED